MNVADEAAGRGVATEYEDWAGEPRQVPESTVRAVLDALDPWTEEAPLTVAREGDPEARGLPVGDYGDLLVAPRRCPLPPPCWGWMVQLYGVHSRASWGIGDFGDLTRLVSWSATEAGAGFVLVNPLHAVAPGLPQEPSPYFPASRRALNPLYLAVEDVPELALADPGVRDEVLRIGNDARALTATPLVDRDAVYTAKTKALELLFPWARHCPPDAFAEWAARAEGRPERAAFHAWLQMLCEEQLGEAQRCARESGMPVGLVLDLAVGVDPDGADAWAQREVVAAGFTVGAPPDSFNREGQDWRLPPWRPDRLRASGYAPFREMVRATLAHAGGIRIDHAMGLWRLYWIPEGASPRDGTYVRYPAGDLLGILAYECHVAGAVAVAEDLGTVEKGVPETLRANGILSSAVLWFEEGGAATYPEQAFTSVTTHDLPTARGFWTDDSLPNAADRARVRSLLGAGPDASVDELVVAMHEFVASTPSLMVAVALGDAIGDDRQPNLPGPPGAYPSWRLRLPVALEDLAVNDVVRAVRTGRSRGPAAR